MVDEFYVRIYNYQNECYFTQCFFNYTIQFPKFVLLILCFQFLSCWNLSFSFISIWNNSLILQFMDLVNTYWAPNSADLYFGLESCLKWPIFHVTFFSYIYFNWWQEKKKKKNLSVVTIMLKKTLIKKINNAKENCSKLSKTSPLFILRRRWSRRWVLKILYISLIWWRKTKKKLFFWILSFTFCGFF